MVILPGAMLLILASIVLTNSDLLGSLTK